MTRPHVLYITPMFGYPAFGGPRLRTYNTLRALARCVDVSLYLTQQPDTPDRERARAHLLGFCRDAVFPAPPARPPLARRLVRRVLPARWRARLRRGAPSRQDPGPAERDPAVIDGLRAWIDLNRPDLIWLGFGGISYDLVRPLRQQGRAPIVLETECVWSRFILRELPFEPDPTRRRRILAEGTAKEAEERSGALDVDLTTAVSEVDAAYFRSIAPSPDRVMLLSNVVDVDAYVADGTTARLQRPALVFAGTLSHGTANVDAGVWLVDDVMPSVWRTRPDVHLYLVGRSPAAAILARRGPRVHVTGEVPSIVPYLRAAAAALVPLRWESGTRFKILEAFACRTPVISTTLGAEGLEVEHGKHLLIADEAAAFARAILGVVDQPELGRRLVDPAFRLVREQYDLASAERQIGSVLERLGARPETWRTP